jgi:hypothetical protein
LENLIRELVELDKIKRQELKQLEEDKSKLGSFLREERKRIEEEYKAEAKKKYDSRKEEIEKIISEAQLNSKKDFDVRNQELMETYKNNKDQWIETLYKYCVGK